MTQYQLPFNNPDLADGFGSMTGRSTPHRGLDFAKPTGTPYGSIADGVVADSGYSYALGYYMVVSHPDGMFSGYCHSEAATPLAVGTVVTRGQFLNYVGNQGQSTGSHLHLTLSTVVYGVTYGQVQDPYPYIQARLGADAAVPPPPAPSLVWTVNAALRPSVTLRSPSGKVRITISAYGAGALLTYEIPGVRYKESGTSTAAAQRAQLVLTNDSTGENTSARTWIQEVPVNQLVTVQVECYGVAAGGFVASPSIVVEVVY